MKVSFIGYVLVAILAHLVWSELICNPFQGMCEGIFLKTENGMGQGNRLISKILYSKNEKFVGNNQNVFFGTVVIR